MYMPWSWCLTSIYLLNCFNKVAPYPVVASYLEVKELYMFNELQLQWLWLNPGELKQALSVHALYPLSNMEAMLVCFAVVQSSDFTQEERMVSGAKQALAWLTVPYGMATQ